MGVVQGRGCKYNFLRNRNLELVNSMRNSIFMDLNILSKRSLVKRRAEDLYLCSYVTDIQHLPLLL